jgi:protein SERAC1
VYLVLTENIPTGKNESVWEQTVSFVNQVLTVPQALVEAKNNDTYHNIRAATFGLVFFATPHRGGNHAKLGDIAANIAKAVLNTSTNTFMDHLQKDSVLSEDLQHFFKHQVENYFILSFYETIPLRIGLVRFH